MERPKWSTSKPPPAAKKAAELGLPALPIGGMVDIPDGAPDMCRVEPDIFEDRPVVHPIAIVPEKKKAVVSGVSSTARDSSFFFYYPQEYVECRLNMFVCDLWLSAEPTEILRECAKASAIPGVNDLNKPITPRKGKALVFVFCYGIPESIEIPTVGYSDDSGVVVNCTGSLLRLLPSSGAPFIDIVSGGFASCSIESYRVVLLEHYFL